MTRVHRNSGFVNAFTKYVAEFRSSDQAKTGRILGLCAGVSATAACSGIDGKTGISMVLTGGERHDMPGFDAMFDQMPSRHELADAVMDKGYDRKHIHPY